MPKTILSFDAALVTVLAHAADLHPPQAVEIVPLLDAQSRTLATPLLADRDQPPFDRSTRDGYAIHAADLSNPLQIIGTLRAGEHWQHAPLAANEAIEIMTGAPLPAGADAVLMVEHADLIDTQLTVRAGRALHSGDNIVRRAAEARAGAQVLPAGRTLNAAELAVAASCGASTLKVFAKPRVAILATGDELVEIDAPPEPHQIRNSNTYSLAALVAAESAIPQRLPIARDTLDDLRARLAEARTADLILFSGGVSMGKFDLVEQALTEAHAEFFFTGALIQPGKPIVFGRLPATAEHPATYFFGLPGNPISTQVCFHLFVAPILRALCGRTDVAPRFVEAKLAEPITGARVTRFLPAELTSAWDNVTVRIVGWQGSGDVAANARGNCYAVLPANVESFTAGETIRVLLR
jgi:molybdopterin molybdotransferase